MTGINSVFSFKVLAAITLAVLLAHLAALRSSPTTLSQSPDQHPRVFITRSIEPIEAPLAPPPSLGTVAAAALPLARARPAPARASPPPAPETALQRQLAAHHEEEAQASPPPPATPVQEPSYAGAAPLTAALAGPNPPHETALAAAAAKLPGSVRLIYQVKANKFPYRLDAELLWQQTGERYEASLELSAFGQTRAQTSRGQITPQGLAPLRFSDKYRSEVAAHFNRAQGKVTFSANTPDVPLLAGAQDRLSVLVQLGAMLASAPERYPKATTIAIQTIGPRDADTWLFTVGESETLALPGGAQATVKLTRNPRQAFDQTVELWLAPGLDYLPARIRITEANGDFVDQQWLSTEPHI